MAKVDRIDHSTDPRTFFRDYVSQRKPVLIDDHLSDPEWKGQLWTNDYLGSKAGDSIVKVERKTEGQIKEFGNGVEEKIPFKEFLKHVERNDDSLYLTTQELDYDSEGRPSLLSPPLTGLIGEFPWHPKIMGNLVLQNANLWMGCSNAKSETSSGLHHDYHDNLYIVLRGTKRLVLFPPSEAPNLYTVGQLEKVHPNGRINYVGQPTLADGSAVSAVKAVTAARKVIEASLKMEVMSTAENGKFGSV